VVYSGRVVVKTSARRFEKHKILSVIREWFKGDLVILMGRRTAGKHRREEY
jgi:hypothetical protein